ncbi:MAG: Hsp20 family protein [Polaromonas sp.]|nr:Hsp20 family protein [Polaromonas sp.]
MFYVPAIHPRHAAPAFRNLDRSLERFVNDALLSGSGRNLEVQQDEKAWTVTLDLPGVGRDQLDIQVEGTAVRIKTKAEAKRQFKAAYELPQEIDVEATRASLESGVLTLVLGKKAPVSQARQIEVK